MFHSDLTKILQKMAQNVSMPCIQSLFNYPNNRVFHSFHKMTDLTFLPMLYIWTDASKLSYVKMLSYAKDWIPQISG